MVTSKKDKKDYRKSKRNLTELKTVERITDNGKQVFIR